MTRQVAKTFKSAAVAVALAFTMLAASCSSSVDVGAPIDGNSDDQSGVSAVSSDTTEAPPETSDAAAEIILTPRPEVLPDRPIVESGIVLDREATTNQALCDMFTAAELNAYTGLGLDEGVTDGGHLCIYLGANGSLTFEVTELDGFASDLWPLVDTDHPTVKTDLEDQPKLVVNGTVLSAFINPHSGTYRDFYPSSAVLLANISDRLS